MNRLVAPADKTSLDRAADPRPVPGSRIRLTVDDPYLKSAYHSVAGAYGTVVAHDVNHGAQVLMDAAPNAGTVWIGPDELELDAHASGMSKRLCDADRRTADSRTRALAAQVPAGTIAKENPPIPI